MNKALLWDKMVEVWILIRQAWQVQREFPIYSPHSLQKAVHDYLVFCNNVSGSPQTIREIRDGLALPGYFEPRICRALVDLEKEYYCRRSGQPEDPIVSWLTLWIVSERSLL